MRPTVYCDCGKMFEAEAQQIGGIVNCPGCGKAVDVPGLNDPFWRVLQAGVVIAIVGVTWLVSQGYGIQWGMIWGGGLAVAVWLLSFAF